jgi:hypothetical protein
MSGKGYRSAAEMVLAEFPDRMTHGATSKAITARRFLAFS